MHAKDRLHGELVKQAVLDHLARAAAALFGRLKYQVNRAVEITVFSQVLSGCQQHGGVAVMAAGVHLARCGAGVRKLVELLHGQRIHVGTQADATPASAAVAPVDDADHPGGAHAAVHFDAPAAELLCHHFGGTKLFKAQLGVRMNIASHAGDGGGLGEDRVNEFHVSAR